MIGLEKVCARGREEPRDYHRVPHTPVPKCTNHPDSERKIRD